MVSSLFVGCKRDSASTAEVKPAPALAATPTTATLYDAQGQVLASDTQIAGLTLPRGLELQFTAEREHTYYSAVSVEKLIKFFHARLATNRVERVGSTGMAFRTAKLKEPAGSGKMLDVSILPIARRDASSRVSIVELLPLPEHPPTEKEVLEHIRRSQQRMD